mgnify:CR=1 FL=1
MVFFKVLQNKKKLRRFAPEKCYKNKYKNKVRRAKIGRFAANSPSNLIKNVIKKSRPLRGQNLIKKNIKKKSRRFAPALFFYNSRLFFYKTVVKKNWS